MSKRILMLLTALVAGTIFGVGALYVARSGSGPTPAQASLVRPHSPVIGKLDAPVTIVEFFDPMCEACRAFYPIVKRIMAVFPNDVRLVLRYTPFHEGSDVAVRILEAARAQDRLEPVLDILMARQPEWAAHGTPDLEKAWSLAGSAGLDVTRARAQAMAPAVDRVLESDIADVKSANVQQTPSFFVNGRPLQSFGAQQLYDLVASEVKQARESGR